MANKTLLVAQREFLENVRTKTFWIGILAFPAIFAVSIGIGWLMQKTKAQQKYAVLDYSATKLGDAIEENARANDLISSLRKLAESQKGAAAEQIKAQLDNIELTRATAEAFSKQIPEDMRTSLQGILVSVAAKYRLVPIAELDSNGGDRAQQEQALNAKLKSGELFAYFVLDGDPVAKTEGLTYFSENHTDDSLREWYSEAATRVVRKLRIAAADIAPAVAKHIQEHVAFKPKEMGADGKVKDVSDSKVARDWAPVAFVYLLWIAVFTAAQMLLTNTVEEKSNRIIEVLLSSVSPDQLMAGKIWGIGATGLTIVTSWALFGVIGVTIGANVVPVFRELRLTEIVRDPLYLASFIGYFFTGYLLFAAVLVAIGSVCNSLKEAQNLVQPVFLLLMIPLFAMIPIVQEPNGLMAKVFTFIPLYTPFAMMNRASGPPAPWEYAVTTVIILVSVFVAFKAAGKIFRIGVLMTGNPPKLKEIIGWLREK